MCVFAPLSTYQNEFKSSVGVGVGVAWGSVWSRMAGRLAGVNILVVDYLPASKFI